MRYLWIAVIPLIAFGYSASAQNSISQRAAPALPPPAMNTSQTTPSTLPPNPNLLPQARQVGNPTGPVNAYPGFGAPKLPQAPQVKTCPYPNKPNCGH